MLRLKYLYTVAFFICGIVMQIPEIKASDNFFTLGGDTTNQLRIEVLSNGGYQVYRYDGSWTHQFYTTTVLFSVKIGSTVYHSYNLVINDISATTTGTQQHITKQFLGTYQGNSFTIIHTINYNTSNPDYFILSTTIDASNIPHGTPISLAYGFDAYVNGCDGGAAITVPDLGYNNQLNSSAQTRDLTQAQVRGLRLVGGINSRGNGSLIGFFTLGRSFDRAVSAHYTFLSTNGSNMISNYQNTFLFGPYAVPSCSGGSTWDNGVGVAYDDIPAGETTTIRTGLTFTSDMDGELDYTWNGSKDMTANIGDHVNLDLTYRSYNSLTITDIGFDVDLRGLEIDAACTQSGFLTGTYACTMGSSAYGVSGASIYAYDSAMMSVPVVIMQCGQWIIGADAISNMSRTLPLGAQATLTVVAPIHLAPLSNDLCQDDSLSFVIAFPPGVSSAFDFHVNLSYTGDLTSFGTLPATVLFPADSNSIRVAVQSLPGAQNNAMLHITLAGADKVFVTLDTVAATTITLLFGVPNALTTTDVFACRNAPTVISVGSQDTTATLTWYSDAACTQPVASGASFTTIATTDTLFYVKSVSNNSCDNYDSVRVSLHPSPILTTGDVVVCPGATAVIAATTANPHDTLRWYSDARYANQISPSGTFSVTATAGATYYVRATSEHRCTAEASAILTLYPQPVITVNNTSACAGATVTIVATTANPTDTLHWYSDAQYTNQISPSGTFSLAATAGATYYVRATSEHHCTAEASAILTLYPQPVITVYDTTVCAGVTATIAATTANPADTLRWYGDAGYSTLLAQSPTYTTPPLTTDAMYYIEASGTQGGCRTWSAISVAVTAPPQVIAMDDRRICYGDEITLSLQYADGDITWNTPELTASLTATQSYVVTASRHPCPDVHDTVTITVNDELYVLPDALPPYKRRIPYAQPLTTNAILPVYSLIEGQLPAGILLMPDGILEGLPFQIEYNDVGYEFRIQVTDQYGCSAFKQYKLRGGFFIPEVFSPNSDGINDYFMKGLRVIIFDRLGRKLFEGNDGWDGTHNGHDVPEDTYYHILYYQDENANEIHATGFITVIR
ncbi:MAG: gliding motility-associated C-terminal domain-containing protein [Prevotellaceae bacterium]|jgi:gliding motility-associated-like protein|nr:gliding motility-associated C-terminal domain-containing protein [Prevotellaceae bacterium]